MWFFLLSRNFGGKNFFIFLFIFVRISLEACDEEGFQFELNATDLMDEADLTVSFFIPIFHYLSLTTPSL